MAFIDEWRVLVETSLADFADWAHDANDVDFIKGVLPTTLLWPIRERIRDFDLETIQTVHQITSPGGSLILKAMQTWSSEPVHAMKIMSAQFTAHEEVCTGVTRLIQTFGGVEVLTQRLARAADIQIATPVKPVPMQIEIFVSSKMEELSIERRTLYELIRTLSTDRVTFVPWVFEFSALAKDKPIRDVYLEQLKQCSLYIGLFWKELGDWTKDEFEQATKGYLERHLYVKDVDTKLRSSGLKKFLKEQSSVTSGITAKWFRTNAELSDAVRLAIQAWADEVLPGPRGNQFAIVARKGALGELSRELPATFVGRTRLLASLHELLNQKKRVVLQGFGGIGKTAIAATVAAQWLEQDKGPVLWLQAGMESADVLFVALAQAFNAQDRLMVTGDERRMAVHSILVENNVQLLILDNVWSDRALVPVINAVPANIPILITSRNRYLLDNGEIKKVDVLTDQEALELLGLHAQRDYSTDKGARDLCKALGNLPFALSIASKTLYINQFTPTELMKRIANALDEMDDPVITTDPRRKNVAALIQASLNVLSPDIQSVFVAFGALFGPSSTDDLLNRFKPKSKAVIALEELQRRGLAERIPATEETAAYYRILDVTYNFARKAAVKKRLKQQPLLNACMSYARAHRDDIKMLHAERSNLLGAAKASKQVDYLIEMMDLLTVKSQYFGAHGHTPDSLELLQKAIAACRETDRLETAHYLLSKLGNTLRDQIGDLEGALKAYQEALELARRLKNTNREAILLSAIGITRFRQKADDANRYLEDAYQIARLHNDDQALSLILQNRSYIAITQEKPDHEAGWRFANEAVQVAIRLIPNEDEENDVRFDALLNRGGCEQELGRLDEALITHKHAHDLAQKWANPLLMAAALRGLGEDYHVMGQRDRALECFNRAVELWESVGAQAEINDLIAYMKKNGYPVPDRFSS